MKIIVNLEASEVQVVKEVANRFVPNFKFNVGHKTKKGVFGSTSVTNFGDTISLSGVLDNRIIPGVWKAVDKYSAQITGIVMMVKGLFQTYVSVAAGLAQEIDSFIQDFKKQAKEDKSEEKVDVVDKTRIDPTKESVSFGHKA